MRLLKSITGGLAAVLLSTAAFAADHKLTIASWAPPTHGMNAKMWPGLIAKIEEATGGKVTGEIKYRLAPPPAMMDLVMDGAADMTWIFHGYSAGRFTATKLIELPGYEGSAEAASVAYWRVHEAHLAKLDEHKGVKVIGLMTHGPAQLHSGKKVGSLADVSGMKLRVPGGVGGDVGAALGATGIKVPAPKVYETLASNAADGVVMPMEARKGFKLTEVAQNVFEMPGGYYRGSFALIMSQEAFDALPADIQKVLDDKVFGEALSRMAGQVWDEIDKEGRAVTEATDGNAIVSVPEVDVKGFAKIAEQVRQKVLAEIEAKGIDSKAAFDMVKKEMAAN